MMKRCFYLALIACVLLFFSCNAYKNKEKYDIAPDGTVSEIEVLSRHENDAPKDAYFYKLNDKGEKTDEITKEIHYYADKQIYIEGGIKNGVRHGSWIAYFPDGKVQTQANFVNGKEDGDYIVYRDNGIPYYKGHYTMGICDKTWQFVNENGKLNKEIVADQNTIVCGLCAKCLALKEQQ